MRNYLAAVFLFLTLSSAWGQRMDPTRAARMLRRPHAEAQFIIKFREASVAPDADSVLPYSGGGVRELRRIGDGEFHLLQTETGGQEVLASLSEHPEIEYIEPNYVISVNKTANDPYFGQQWGPKKAEAEAAWDYATGTRQTVVAVIDTGVDFNHPDLAANIWAAPRPFTFNGAAGVVSCPAGSRGVNAITSTCVPMDDNGHGTHCAGIIGAAGNNGSGVAGVSWTASILPVKFLNSKGSGLLSDALRAIDSVVQIKKQFGAEANVRVISASWGFAGSSISLESAIAAANTADILFVAAAGNTAANNDTRSSFPANSTQPNVMSVAATDQADALASFSNYGLKVHLGAPGVSIASTYLDGQYAMLSGTSMATPMVAGAAALLLSTCTANTAALRQHLLASVDAVPGLAGKTETGGRLNIYKAIRRCATPSATLSATPSSRTIQAGQATAYSLLPGGGGGVTGSGTIAITGAPAGVTASVAGPVTLDTAVNVNVTTTGATAAGTYNLTATLTASTYKATVTLTMIVQAVPLFTFTATAPAAAIKAGTSGTVAVAITRAAGFTGAVVVTPQTLPAGITAAPLTIASGQTTGSLIVNAATTAAGTYNLTATLTASTYKATVSLTLRVQASSLFSFTATAPAAAIKAGTSGTVAVAITRAAGFTGAVVVTPQTLSAGITAAPLTIASGQTTGSLIVNVATTAAGGSAVIGLAATGGTPVTSVSKAVTVTVDKPASLTLAFTAAQYSVKAGTKAAMDFVIASSTPLRSMQFSLSGMLGAAPVGISPLGPNNYRLTIATPLSWSGRTASLKLTLSANGLTSSSTASLVVTP